MKLSEIAIVLLKLIFYSLSILGIYWVVLKITGHSPTDISTLRVQMNILMAGFGFGFVLLVKVLSDVKKLEDQFIGSQKQVKSEFEWMQKHMNAEFGWIQKQIKSEFDSMRREFDLLRADFDSSRTNSISMKTDMAFIKKDLLTIKTKLE